jgi:glycosyltransferase involved in cell wall biosynthesis
MPHVSICLTTYNQRRYIRDCLESVLAQARECGAEILIGDDCSDDGTSEIAAEFAATHPAIATHFRHAPRRGAAFNTKALLAHCRGEYVARVDGDDYWLPGKLGKQIGFLDTHADCSAVYTNAITIDEAGNRLGVFNDAGDSRFDLTALLRRGNFLNNSSVLFRRKSIEPWLAIEGPLIDYRAHLLHARFGYLAQLGEPLTAYRVNARGSMVAGMNDKVRELYWEAIMSVPRETVADRDFAVGLADFLRRVTFRAVRTRNWAMLQNWAERVYASSPYGRTRTSALTLASILRILAREGAELFRRDAAGNRLRVLYHA